MPEYKYWLCECGEEFKNNDKLHGHCRQHRHYAELIVVDESGSAEVIGFIAYGINDDRKYSTGVPDSAQIKREKNKNDPMFKRQ